MLVSLFVKHNLECNVTMHLNELQSISLCPLFIRHSVTGYCEQSSENIGFVEVCAFVFYVGGHKLQKDSIDGII